VWESARSVGECGNLEGMCLGIVIKRSTLQGKKVEVCL